MNLKGCYFCGEDKGFLRKSDQHKIVVCKDCSTRWVPNDHEETEWNTAAPITLPSIHIGDRF